VKVQRPIVANIKDALALIYNQDRSFMVQLPTSWNIHRSVRLGPLRLNFSKRGIGWSVGVRGARIGVDARGRTYSQMSIGKERHGRNYAPCSLASFAMSSGRLFLDRVGRHYCLPRGRAYTDSEV
jgi:hypothetical protein